MSNADGSPLTWTAEDQSNYDTIKKLREQIADFQWFEKEITKYVMPGEIDTEGSALLAFKKLNDRVSDLEQQLSEYQGLYENYQNQRKKLTLLKRYMGGDGTVTRDQVIDALMEL